MTLCHTRLSLILGIISNSAQRGATISDSTEFLEGWFAAFYRFDGLILVLQAFFDETGGHESHDVTAVAGFVYNKAGLTEFTEAWGRRVASLPMPYYRSASCNAGAEPFTPPDWDRDRRESFMDELANLSTRHALAGFVVATRKSDYEDACENGPGIKKLIHSPYTLCLMGVLSEVSDWVARTSSGKRCFVGLKTARPARKNARLIAR